MFGDAYPQLDPSIGQPLAQPLQMPAPKKKGGLFGSGGVKVDLGRAIAGYLAGIGNPAGIQALQAMNAQRQSQQEAEMAEQQYQRRRDDGYNDWVKQQLFKLSHPETVNNDTVADFNFITQQLGADAGKEYLRNRANPPRLQFIQGVGLVDVSQLGGGQTPTRPVGKLTPIDEGGAGQVAPRPFP